VLTYIKYKINLLLYFTMKLDVIVISLRLEDLAKDLMEGLKRFNASDYEGAITALPSPMDRRDHP